MNEGRKQIDLWLRADGAQTPLLIVGQKERALDQVVEEMTSRAIADQLISTGDIETLVAEKRNISIKQVRSFIAGARLKPIKQRRILYIKQAHCLSQAAASALLKTLEEAPDYARYILTSKWPGRLLITIRSRCRRLTVNEDVSKPEEVKNVTRQGQEPMSLNIADDIDETHIESIAKSIVDELNAKGPSRELKLLLLRLVDYYRIKEKGGNEKMAKEVLLAHLTAEIKSNLYYN